MGNLFNCFCNNDDILWFLLLFLLLFWNGNNCGCNNRCNSCGCDNIGNINTNNSCGCNN